MNKICVILGAGASHDVWNGSSPIINPAFRPPLARDLFDIANHTAYWDVLRNYPGAQVITDLLAPFTTNDEFSVEQELRKYANHTDVRLQQNFKFVPPYLRDLINLCSLQYTESPGSYTKLVSELLSETPHEILFLVLNYDNLLEKALTKYDTNLTFPSISDYVKEGRQAKVVKLHGSIDWSTRFCTHPQRGWDDLVRDLDLAQRPEERAIVVWNGPAKVRDAQRDSNWIYPLITAPLAGKGLTDAVCPESHLNAARDFLKDCKKFLIIGTSGLDEDLITFLNSTVQPRSDIIVQLVGVASGSEAVLDRFEEGVRAFRGRWARAPESEVKNGFRTYLTSGAFRSFAQGYPR